MNGLGIAVIGFARPNLLTAVLESLSRQNALSFTHVWIDGTHSRAEFLIDPRASAEAARAFPVAEIRTHGSHMGIQKLMIDILSVMSINYRKFIIIEDDCFPLRNAVRLFDETLQRVYDDPEVYSVYGHHWGLPNESDRFTRFQGWGWATTRTKVEGVLPELRRLFNLPEKEYHNYIAGNLTPAMVERLDVTPGRNVLGVLRAHFSWDSCMSFITAQRGLVHCRTSEPAIRNCGLTPGQGSFPTDRPDLRLPPFNMVSAEEVWNLW